MKQLILQTNTNQDGSVLNPCLFVVTLHKTKKKLLALLILFLILTKVLFNTQLKSNLSIPANLTSSAFTLDVKFEPRVKNLHFWTL